MGSDQRFVFAGYNPAILIYNEDLGGIRACGIGAVQRIFIDHDRKDAGRFQGGRIRFQKAGHNIDIF